MLVLPGVSCGIFEVASSRLHRAIKHRKGALQQLQQARWCCSCPQSLSNAHLLKVAHEDSAIIMLQQSVPMAQPCLGVAHKPASKQLRGWAPPVLLSRRGADKLRSQRQSQAGMFMSSCMAPVLTYTPCTSAQLSARQAGRSSQVALREAHDGRPIEDALQEAAQAGARLRQAQDAIPVRHA